MQIYCIENCNVRPSSSNTLFGGAIRCDAVDAHGDSKTAREIFKIYIGGGLKKHFDCCNKMRCEQNLFLFDWNWVLHSAHQSPILAVKIKKTATTKSQTWYITSFYPRSLLPTNEYIYEIVYDEDLLLICSFFIRVQFFLIFTLGECGTKSADKTEWFFLYRLWTEQEKWKHKITYITKYDKHRHTRRYTNNIYMYRFSHSIFIIDIYVNKIQCVFITITITKWPYITYS